MKACRNRMAQKGPEGDKGLGIRPKAGETDVGGLLPESSKLVNFWRALQLAHVMQGVHG